VLETDAGDVAPRIPADLSLSRSFTVDGPRRTEGSF